METLISILVFVVMVVLALSLNMVVIIIGDMVWKAKFFKEERANMIGTTLVMIWVAVLCVEAMMRWLELYVKWRYQ